MDEPVVFVPVETETRCGQITAKYPHLGLQVFVEARKFQMQLQCLPEAQLRFLLIFRTHQHI